MFQFFNFGPARQIYKDAIGQSTWLLLHALADHFDSEDPAHEIQLTVLMTALATLYPCQDCRAHMSAYLNDHPPRFENRAHAVRWMFNFHNSVNERLGKPLMSAGEYPQRLTAYDGVAASGQCAGCSTL